MPSIQPKRFVGNFCWVRHTIFISEIYTSQEDWAQTSWFFDLWTFKLEANNMLLYTFLNKWKREKIETATYLVCRPRRFPLYFIWEVKHDVYGKRQKWNFCRLSSAVCTVEWNYLYLQWVEGDIFVGFIYGLEEKNRKSEVVFAVCRLPLTSCLTSLIFPVLLSLQPILTLSRSAVKVCLFLYLW